MGLKVDSAESPKSIGNYLTSIFENIPDMVFIKDAKHLRFVFINRAGEELLGIPGSELLGRNDYDFFPAVQAEFFTRKDREVLESGTVLDISEEEINAKSGEIRVLHTKKVPIFDVEGNPVFLLGISEDITRRKQAELAAVQAKECADQFLRISRAMIIGLNCEGDVSLINPRGCEILGYSEEEIMGRNWFDTVVPVAERATVEAVFRRVISGDIEPHIYYENEILNKRGDVRFIAWNNTVVKNSQGEITGTLSSGQDMTERRHAEEKVRQHQQEIMRVMRKSAVGEMASGLAHELNQPLSAVTSYCEAALTMIENPSISSPVMDLDEVLRRAVAQARRASDVIRHFRGFVKKDDIQKSYIDVDQLVQNVIRFFGQELQRPHLLVELRLQAQGSKIFACEVQIEQVLINLLLNGRDAINSIGAKNGRMIIQTRILPNNFVEISLSDNGPGISESMIEKIFELFQTTKEGGMGIGLSISRSIIENHGGHMWMANLANGGAVFGIELPINCD
jgi:PAS domain S-box-containing protein